MRITLKNVKGKTNYVVIAGENYLTIDLKKFFSFDDLNGIPAGDTLDIIQNALKNLALFIDDDYNQQVEKGMTMQVLGDLLCQAKQNPESIWEVL